MHDRTWENCSEASFLRGYSISEDMIHSEQTQKRDGYESRVKQLETMEKRMSEL